MAEDRTSSAYSTVMNPNNPPEYGKDDPMGGYQPAPITGGGPNVRFLQPYCSGTELPSNPADADRPSFSLTETFGGKYLTDQLNRKILYLLGVIS